MAHECAKCGACCWCDSGEHGDMSNCTHGCPFDRCDLAPSRIELGSSGHFDEVTDGEG